MLFQLVAVAVSFRAAEHMTRFQQFPRSAIAMIAFAVVRCPLMMSRTKSFQQNLFPC
jgi:hypothetical protein